MKNTQEQLCNYRQLNQLQAGSASPALDGGSRVKALQIFEQRNPNTHRGLVLFFSCPSFFFASAQVSTVAMAAIKPGRPTWPGGQAGGRAGGASQALMSRNINDKVISQLFLPAEAALQFHPSHSLL